MNREFAVAVIYSVIGFIPYYRIDAALFRAAPGIHYDINDGRFPNLFQLCGTKRLGKIDICIEDLIRPIPLPL